MRVAQLICAAVAAMALPASALADDPKDPAMHSRAARARDREGTRQLNLQELATVRQRDAGYAGGWRSDRSDDASAYAARLRDHERALDDYARDRARYERDMAQWRSAVSACRAGDYPACGN